FPESTPLAGVVALALIAAVVLSVVLLARVYQRLGRVGRIVLPVAVIVAIVGLLVATSGSTFTLENYRQTFDASTSDSPDMWQHFINSMAITIPATVIPIAFAAFAAYAFAWLEFKGRDGLFGAESGR